MQYLSDLIKAFTRLPGIGNKSAKRLSLHILSNHRETGKELVYALENAISNIKKCEQCLNFTTDKLCKICINRNRDSSKLCIVESVADLITLEETKIFSGLYFVLHGRLSPIDGIGVEELNIDLLKKLVTKNTTEEIIIATSANVEAEATVHLIETVFSDINIKITRLARGLPLGGDLEYIDLATISEAFINRKLSHQ